MSKMIKALNKAGMWRGGEGPRAQDDVRTIRGKREKLYSQRGVVALSVVLIVVSISSLWTNFEALSHLREEKNASRALLHALNEQKQEINALGSLIVDGSSTELVRMNKLYDELEDLKTAMIEKQQNAAQLQIAYERLKGSIDDLKTADRLMRKKYISLNSDVKKLTDNAIVLIK